MKPFLSLFSVFLLIHVLEDAAVLSIGRFLPVPVWAMYPIGIGISSFFLAGVARRLQKGWRR
ncbi:MAG: hypothetical protein ACE5Q6_08360 [Dehalococcoidia bacterium]